MRALSRRERAPAGRPSATPPASSKIVGEIVHGEMVGEMAHLHRASRAAPRVRALRDSELVRLDRPAFERLIARYPQALMALTRLDDQPPPQRPERHAARESPASHSSR